MIILSFNVFNLLWRLGNKISNKTVQLINMNNKCFVNDHSYSLVSYWFLVHDVGVHRGNTNVIDWW